jgi:hypothetical protein
MIKSPSIAAAAPTGADADEAFRDAVARCVIAIMRASLRRGMTLPECAERLTAVAEIFEREAVHHGLK